MLAMDRISDRASRLTHAVASACGRPMWRRTAALDLYLAAIDGSWVRRLTSHEAADTQPRWSADGRSLFFVSTRSGSSQVWRLPLEGGEAQP